MLTASSGQATQRGRLTANFSSKKLIATTCKEDSHEIDDRLDSAQTEKLKCHKMKDQAGGKQVTIHLIFKNPLL